MWGFGWHPGISVANVPESPRMIPPRLDKWWEISEFIILL